MLQGRGTVVGVDDVARLLVDLADPLCKLSCVRDRGREEDVVNRLWQHDDALLPNDTTLYNYPIQWLFYRNQQPKKKGTFVAHVVDFVKHDPSNLSHDLGAAV